MTLALTVPGDQSPDKITLPDEAFAREFNEPLVHQTVVSYLAGARQGSVKQKNRSEVRGGGRKPWRQKGTGRARAGTHTVPNLARGRPGLCRASAGLRQEIEPQNVPRAMQCIVSELIRRIG